MAKATKALNGSDNYTLHFEVLFKNRNIANNTSTFTYKMWVVKGSQPGAWNNSGADWTVSSPYGTVVQRRLKHPYDFRNYNSAVFASGEFTHTHNSNGTYSREWRADFVGNNSYVGAAFAALTMTASAIPQRPAKPTLSTSSGKTTITGASAGSASSYQAQYRLGSGSWTTVNLDSSRKATVTTGSGTLEVQTRSVNSVGNSSWSPSTTITVVAAAPGAPTLTISDITATGFKHTNTAPSGAGTITGWQTQSSRTSDFSSVSTLTTQNGTWIATRGTSYYLRSRAQNAVGWGAWSTVRTVTTLYTVPGTPSMNGVSDVTSTTAYIGVPTTTDNGGSTITNARLRYGTTNPPTTVQTLGSLTPGFLEGLTPGTLYYVQGGLYNTASANGGWSAYSPVISFQTLDNVPTPPLSFQVAGLGPNYVNFSWDEPASLHGSSILYYTIRIATNKSFGTGLITRTAPAEEVSLLIPGLTPGRKYYAQIWAHSSNGPGSFSSIIEFTTEGSVAAHQGFWLKDSGVWLPVQAWIKVQGVWRTLRIWQRRFPNWVAQDGETTPAGPQPPLPSSTTYPSSGLLPGDYAPVPDDTGLK